MAEKANDEVKNIPSEPIAKLPTLPESLTEKKNRKEDLDKATLSQMSEAIEFPSPYLKLVAPGELSIKDELLQRLKRDADPSIDSGYIDLVQKELEMLEELLAPKGSMESRSEAEEVDKHLYERHKRALEEVMREMVEKRRGHIESSFKDEHADKIPDLRHKESSFKDEDADKIPDPRSLVSRCTAEDAAEIYKFRSLQPSFKAEDATEIYKPQLDIKPKRDINIPGPKRSKSSDIENPSLKRNLTSGDDDVLLDPFLCSRSLEEIRKLIESGKLPSQKILDEMCQIYGRKSKEIHITCQAICEHIESKHAAIAYVWAAYTIQNPHKITFVVIVKHKSEGDTGTEPLGLDKLIPYSFVNQYVGKFSLESAEILRQQTSASEGLDKRSYQKLQSCISKYSEVLMKKHKFLSIISASSNRSKGFGASWKLLPLKCIVLYVQTKNFIPIDEEPFRTNYDGIPVDVREGAFIPFGRTAKDLLDPVKMGSQIGGENYIGTLGFFIDHPQFGICGLTCAHVLLTRWELTQVKEIYGGTLKWPLHGMHKNVYQPADKQSVLGHTVQVIYKEGSNENCGMELALFRITDRHPKSPSFPDETVSNVATGIKYDSWRMCSTDRLNKKEDNHVIKFGSKTELSQGIINFDTIAVKSLDAYPLFHEYAPIKLFKQIEVKPRSNGIPFAEEGDSGAPVFVVEKDSQNKCIGIIEGGTSYGTVVVTPIVPILAELDVPCLKSFDTEREFSNIQNKMDNLETCVQSFGRDVRGLNNNMQTVNHEIQNINRSLQTVDLPKMSGDMQMMKELLLNLTQKFNSLSANSQNDQHGHD